MITFNEKTNLFKLDTPSVSYVMGLADGKYLGQVYFGKRLENGAADLSYLLRIDEPPFTPSVNLREKVSFLDSFPMEYAFGGTGDFRESCIGVITESGQEGLELTYRSHRIYPGKEKLCGLPATWGGQAETLEITLEDAPTGVQTILSYSVFADSDAIMRSVRVKNNGTGAVYIDRVLSACLDIEDADFEVLSLHGSWARERHMQRLPLGIGSYVTESVRGESSHQDHPFLALLTPSCTQESGEVYAMNFVYSGNFLAKAQHTQHDRVRMVMGVHPDYFRWKLEAGESFQAPEAVLVYSDRGLGGMTRTFHDLYRNHLIRSPYKDVRRPVLINNWEATYFDFDTDKLLAIAKEASALGIEMLVMDDGWFGHRNGDNSSLGDWTVNEEKIKGGLKTLVDGVKSFGMKFGIWMEPEMISPDSELYRAHPDWALRLNGREPSLCREQLVLDFSRPEVLDYVYGQISAVLRSVDISYVKWDMNRQLTDPGSSYLPADRQGEASHRHTLGVYALQERLLAEFPDLLLENCSGGGARFDAGMLYYSPQIWCSDDMDAVERLQIQEGTALIYPLSAMGAHVCCSPNHTVGRETPIDMRAAVALAGTFGYELDVTTLSEEEKERIPEQIARYKKYAPLIQGGDYYRIASYRETHTYDCYEIVSKDRSEAVVFFIQVLNEPNRRSRKIRLQGLDGQAVYDVGGKRYTGEALMYAGYILPRPWGDFQPVILELHREK